MTSKFFPTVAELTEAVESLQPKPKGPPPVEEAWDEVCRKLNPYQAPIWTHDAIRLTVQRLGGIRALCECGNIGSSRAHFFKLYEALIEQEKDNTVNNKVVALLSNNTHIKWLNEK
ncbi:hypothetical protein AXX12_04880 [Anaerosporomusa subterranea]|uniref:Uncharacterized protein n=2 Tax=Anaerosporomusa subterranea TaxID=1794912 RepID=A0A154BVD6_ANASB|nr:hypothetical protein AXX12_04880 [Anaerosporomusa subterranea]